MIRRKSYRKLVLLELIYSDKLDLLQIQSCGVLERKALLALKTKKKK